MGKSLIAYIFCFLSISLSAQTKIWFDTDIMIGKFGKDVDDGLALVMALQDSTINIKGISLTEDVDYGEKVTKKILHWYNTEIPIYKGKNEKQGFGDITPATNALVKALTKDKLTVLVLGPITNIATVLQLHPELENQIEHIIICMGRRPGMHFNPGNGKKNMNDYNFDLDPVSMQYVLDSTNIPLTLNCYEAASYLQIGKDDIKPLKAGEKHQQWFYKQMNKWRRQWAYFLKEKRGFFPFDAVTIASLLHPEFLECETLNAEIKTLANDSKFMIKTETKPYFLVSDTIKSNRTVTYCYKVKAAYKGVIINSLLK